MGGNASNRFVSTRGFSSALALLLALSYTKILGLEKRSILAFAMVSSVLLTVVAVSGISLALRNKPREQIKDEEFLGYLILTLALSFLAATINCIFLGIYSYFKIAIPLPIFIVCFMYSFLACCNFAFQDALLAFGRIKLATIFDFLTILIQIFSFLFLISVAQTSLIVSVFLPFIFSYSLIIFATGTFILNNIKIEKEETLSGILSILSQSKGQHIYGIATGLADRADKFLVGLLLPVTFLAKYSLLAGFTSFVRFLPDAFAKILLVNFHNSNVRLNKSYSKSNSLIVWLLGFGFLMVAQASIFLVFGRQWLLPFSVGLLLMTQEFLRANFQIQVLELITQGMRRKVTLASAYLIFISIVSLVLFLLILGILGAPLAMCASYLFVTLKIKNWLGGTKVVS